MEIQRVDQIVAPPWVTHWLRLLWLPSDHSLIILRIGLLVTPLHGPLVLLHLSQLPVFGIDVVVLIDAVDGKNTFIIISIQQGEKILWYFTHPFWNDLLWWYHFHYSQGDCDTDSECMAGLKCFIRDDLTPIPGCPVGVMGVDYCYLPGLTPQPTRNPTPWPTSAPTPQPTPSIWDRCSSTNRCSRW